MTQIINNEIGKKRNMKLSNSLHVQIMSLTESLISFQAPLYLHNRNCNYRLFFTKKNTLLL